MKEITNKDVIIFIVFMVFVIGIVFYVGAVSGTNQGIDYMNDYIGRACTCIKGIA